MGIQARNPNEDDQERDEDSSGDPLEPAYDGGVGAPLLTEVDHVAVVVADLAEAIAEQRERFGVLVADREELFDEAAEVAFLEVGGSSIKIDQMGVTIKGMMIKVEGSIMTEVKGLMTTVKADAILTAKGSITMIN